MKRLIPLILAVAVVTAACGGGSVTTTTVATTTTLDPDTPEGALAAARRQWAEDGLASYRLATSEICFCPETAWINTIVDGVVVTHEAAGDESFFDPGPRSMETLFDEIAAAIAEGYETLDVEYHPETGAVVSYYVDVEALMADEEYGVQVTSLTPYDPEAPTVTIGTPADCGRGPVAATLAGGVVESASGEQVTLDTVELVNTGWGCFAG